MTAVAAGQIWRDDRYYLDKTTGEYKRKYVLVLSVEPRSHDTVTAVFTSKSHGLRERPACDPGPPRAGYFLGIPGNGLNSLTWVDFSSVRTLDSLDMKRYADTGRMCLLSWQLDAPLFCRVLRCASQSEDLTMRQARWISDTLATLHCP